MRTLILLALLLISGPVIANQVTCTPNRVHKTTSIRDKSNSETCYGHRPTRFHLTHTAGEPMKRNAGAFIVYSVDQRIGHGGLPTTYRRGSVTHSEVHFQGA